MDQAEISENVEPIKLKQRICAYCGYSLRGSKRMFSWSVTPIMGSNILAFHHSEDTDQSCYCKWKESKGKMKV